MASQVIDYCKLCGAIATDTHHLIGGRNRAICDADRITMRLCRDCHISIHQSGIYELKCKALGQELYELKQMVVFSQDEKQAHERFMHRYGKNYI